MTRSGEVRHTCPARSPLDDRLARQFTEAYAVIPRGVMSDIVTSVLPFWEHTQAWMLARPLSGFSETFAQSRLHKDVDRHPSLAPLRGNP
ncbi:hypothetical protein ASG51_17045 [Methylobacterium sp. Leaf465]|nr:hypothetical protein ASG51_17045 [Methylobacterium sp. Leaf465]